jgi:hypothetical protein
MCVQTAAIFSLAEKVGIFRNARAAWEAGSLRLRMPIWVESSISLCPVVSIIESALQRESR